MSASSDQGAARTPRRVVLPDVVGLNRRDALVVLRSAGFESVRLHYTEAYASEHDIVRQTPAGGILVDRHQEILLHVCRQNLVQFLPNAYQESARAPESFLRGFLYIVQHLQDRVGQRLDRIHELFDPRTTDPEFLPWLASWMATSLNSEWGELESRKMLLAATQMFSYRGTAKAIAEFVRIYTSANVQIEENQWPFKGFRVGVHSTVGVDTVILPPMNLAHCFVVRLDRAADEVPEDEIVRIHEIIQLQKPAHTSYFLAFADESRKREMGAFMEIGGGMGIGTGGVGMSVGAPPDALTDAPGAAESPSDKAAKGKGTKATKATKSKRRRSKGDGK